MSEVDQFAALAAKWPEWVALMPDSLMAALGTSYGEQDLASTHARLQVAERQLEVDIFRTGTAL